MKKLSISIFLAIVIGCGSKEDASQTAAELGVPGGAVCGSEKLIGTSEPGFQSGGCGMSTPVKIFAVSGITLSTPALVTCDAALALEKWVDVSLKPEAAKIDKRVREITTFQSYACRTRNHRKGAKLSEHAKGHAFDIGGFTFVDGSKTVLLDDYYGKKYGGFLSQIRKGACGPFGTVLGPGTDALHRNHFHFDVADYRSGPYCR